MSELRRTFTSGKMNKDLDERLVPEGEYRDAVNIEVSTSENSDMGAIQSVMGNTPVSVDFYATSPGLGMEISPNAICIGEIVDEKNDKLYWFVCDDAPPTGYDKKDIIAEYDAVTNTVLPVIVDIWDEFGATRIHKRVLNFSTTFPITGINIIDDMLFWTDNNSEPKKINITRSKSGCIHPHPSTGTNVGYPRFDEHTNFVTTHPIETDRLWLGSPTTVTRRLREKHVTVIREAPLLTPSLQMKRTASRTDDSGTLLDWTWDPSITTGANPGTWGINPFFNQNTNAVLGECWIFYGGVNVTGGAQTFTFPMNPTYNINDIITITNTAPLDPNETEEIRVRILEGPNLEYGGYRVEVLNIHSNIIHTTMGPFTTALTEASPYYRHKFARFATRYKYEDGEYSAFSPFSEPAFLPSEFNYEPKQAYNLGMESTLKYFSIYDFIGNDLLTPQGVVSIDILYKESDSPNIYLLKTIKRNDKEWSDRWDFLSNDVGGNVSYDGVKGYVEIQSEVIHAAIPSNQYLRPWDNVPRRALGQEVSGNRLIYGNYLQNYNLTNYFNASQSWEIIELDLEMKMESRGLGNILAEQHFAVNALEYYPAKSIKTLRTYQLGVVYTDRYGRQTPVFSSSKDGLSSMYLEKSFSNHANQLVVKTNHVPPAWADTFKFFIKETSNEYYNLSLDRWYNAEDGNIWLSFPSAERNKVDEETYLILKKYHDSNDAVTSPARYKIISIENEAPDYIKQVYQGLGKHKDLSQGSGATYIGFSDGTNNSMFGLPTGIGWPRSGLSYFIIDEDNAWNKTGWNESIFGTDKTDLYLRFGNGQVVTKWYKMVGAAKYSTGYIRVDVDEGFDGDVDQVTNTSNGAPVTANTVIVSSNTFLEIREKVIDSTRPEFDGRFFVKIIKDAVFDRTIAANGPIISNSYRVLYEKVVRYIDSYNAWSHYGEDFYDFIGNNEEGYWDGYNISNRDLISTYDQDDTEILGSAMGGSLFHRYFFNASREQTEDNTFRAYGGENQWGMHDNVRQYWGEDNGVPWNKAWEFGNGPWRNAVYPVFQAPMYATSENIIGKMNTATFSGGTNTAIWTEMRGGGEAFWRAFCKWSGDESNKGKAHWFIDRRCRFYEMSQIRFPTTILAEAGMLTRDYIKDVWGLMGPWGPGFLSVHALRDHIDVWTGYRDQTYGWLDDTENIEGAYGGFAHTVAMMPPTSVAWGPWLPEPGVYNLYDYNTPTFHGTQSGSAGIGAYNQNPNEMGNTSIGSGWYSGFAAEYWKGSQEIKPYSQGIYDSTGLGIVDTIDLSAVIPHGNNGSWPMEQVALGPAQGFMKNAFTTWAWMKQWEGANGEYVNDLAFINKLTTKNTLWKWAEDPHVDSAGDRVGIIYKTTGAIDSCGTIANFVQRIAFHDFEPGVPPYQNTMIPHSGMPRLLDEVFYLGASAYHSYNKTARWRFKARVASDPSVGLGETGPSYYLPTNDPRWIEGDNTNATDPWDATGLASNPPTSPEPGRQFNPLGAAPGIRSDGMHNGAELNIPVNNGDKVGQISSISGNSSYPNHWPGQVTWLILEPELDEGLHLPQSTNPAIFETEPKESSGLDVYHEVSQVYPITLNQRTSELYIPTGSIVSCYRPLDSPVASLFGTGTVNLGNVDYHTLPIRVKEVNDNVITLIDSTPGGIQLPGPPPPPPGPHDFQHNNTFLNEHITVGDILTFTRPDGSTTSAEVQGVQNGSANYMLIRNVHNMEMTLPWFNCWAFGNGVESNRIRDDYNAVYLDKGPRVSATLEDAELGGSSYKYKEERRGSGLIYSGIYNSMSGINNLNQFVAAEKITKDLNPTYGTIQKLFSRNTDLITFCEDRVLKVLANKDAMFNADGNINVTSNLNVLGQAMPYSGDYGISKDPESFASESFRAYFTDRNRGVVLRLSQDGLTPISEFGMKDWFSDHLKDATKIIGSFDEKKTNYNVTFKNLAKTVSFSERSKGWESFKSFSPERGTSFNNEYYTIKWGHLWKHHDNQLHNNFYGSNLDDLGKLNVSSVKFLFNTSPDIVKSFNTLNYEGSQARITQDIATYAPPLFGDGEYYDNYDTSGGYVSSFTGKLGWYVDSMVTNLQEVPNLEFKDKEGKWFSTIKGESTTLSNLDTNEFSVQGIGNATAGITNTPISGCADANAASANFYGHTNAIVQNYDPAADHDCIGDTVYQGVVFDLTCCVYCEPGCTDPAAYNHDWQAGCYTIGPAGGNAPYSVQTPNTTYSADDGSCEYCADPTYWDIAITNSTTNLGTCQSNNDGSIDFRAQSNNIAGGISGNPCGGVNIDIMDNNYNSIGNFPYNVPNGTLLSDFLSNQTVPTSILIPSGVYNIQICDDTSCATGTACGCSYFQLTVFSDTVQAGCTDNGSMDSTINTGYQNNLGSGCTPYPQCEWGSVIPGLAASNYDPFAVCDDGSCLYPIRGCIDPLAWNFDPTAVIDDNSCVDCSNVVSCPSCPEIKDGDFGYKYFQDYGNYSGSPSATTMISTTFNGGGQWFPYWQVVGQGQNTIIQLDHQWHDGGKSFLSGSPPQPTVPNINIGTYPENSPVVGTPSIVWPPSVQTRSEPWRFRHWAWDTPPNVTTPVWEAYNSDDYMYWWTLPWNNNGNWQTGVDRNYYKAPAPVHDQIAGGAIESWNVAGGFSYPERPGIILELHGARDDGSNPGGQGSIVSGSMQTAGGNPGYLADNTITIADVNSFGNNYVGESFDPYRYSNGYNGIYTAINNLAPDTCYKVEVTVQRLPLDINSPAEPYGWYGPDDQPKFFGRLRISAGPTLNYRAWNGATSYPGAGVTGGYAGTLEPYFADYMYYGDPLNCSSNKFFNEDFDGAGWDKGPSINQGPVTYVKEFVSNDTGSGYLGLDFRHDNFQGGGGDISTNYGTVTWRPSADKIIITNVCISKAPTFDMVTWPCDTQGAHAQSAFCCQGPNIGGCSPAGGDFGFGYNNCKDVIQGGASNCCDGCTDSQSSNYDSWATCDDGSCVSCVYGCMDDGNKGQNYWEENNYDVTYSQPFYPGNSPLGSFQQTSGWYGNSAPYQALNYDSNATCDDGSCLYPDVVGCITNTIGDNPSKHDICRPGNNPQTCTGLGCCGAGGGYSVTNFDNFATVQATTGPSACTIPSNYPGCMDPYACNFNAIVTHDCAQVPQTPDYSLGPASNNGGTNTTFGDVGCCDYNTAQVADINPNGNSSPRVYTWDNYSTYNSNYSLWADVSVIFDTSNRTVKIEDKPTFTSTNPFSGPSGSPKTYYWRHCIECGGGSSYNPHAPLEIFGIANDGSSNVPYPVYIPPSTPPVNTCQSLINGSANQVSATATLEPWSARFFHSSYWYINTGPPSYGVQMYKWFHPFSWPHQSSWWGGNTGWNALFFNVLRY